MRYIEEPVIIKQFPDPAAIRAMRSQLFKASYRHPLLRKVFDAAAEHGLTGEEMYVLACYYLLVDVEDAHNREIQRSNFGPTKPFTAPKPEEGPR